MKDTKDNTKNKTVKPSSAAQVICDTLANCTNNEATRSPYWLILDPKQNMNCDVYNLASQISGPFFSREDAENYLKSRCYNYSDRAVVFCHSGYYSKKYDNLCNELGIY